MIHWNQGTLISWRVFHKLMSSPWWKPIFNAIALFDIHVARTFCKIIMDKKEHLFFRVWNIARTFWWTGWCWSHGYATARNTSFQVQHLYCVQMSVATTIAAWWPCHICAKLPSSNCVSYQDCEENTISKSQNNQKAAIFNFAWAQDDDTSQNVIKFAQM